MKAFVLRFWRDETGATAHRGGYFAGDLVMVVRHGATFPDQADTDPLNFELVPVV